MRYFANNASLWPVDEAGDHRKSLCLSKCNQNLSRLDECLPQSPKKIFEYPPLAYYIRGGFIQITHIIVLCSWVLLPAVCGLLSSATMNSKQGCVQILRSPYPPLYRGNASLPSPTAADKSRICLKSPACSSSSLTYIYPGSNEGPKKRAGGSEPMRTP